MRHEPWTIADWRRVAQTGVDVMAHAAVRLALAGDVASLQNWVEFAGSSEAAGQEASRSTHGVRLNLRVEYEPGKWREESLKNMTMMVAVALALHKDPGEQGANPTANDISLAFDLNARQRQSWTGEDDALVRSGIQLWRGDEPALGEFYLACARFINHPGFVQSFIAEGVSLASLSAVEQSDSLREDQEISRIPTGLGWMARNGNLAGAAALLEQLAPGESASNDADWLIRAFQDHIRPADNKRLQEIWGAVDLHMAEEAVARQREGATEGIGPVATGALALLNTLSRWDKAAMGWPMRAQFLRQYLDNLDSFNARPEAAVVDALLRGASARGLTLEAALQERPGVWWENEKNDRRKVLMDLVLQASASHAVEVLKVARPWIEHPESAQDLSHDKLLASAALRSTRRVARLVPEDFCNTLRFLDDLGAPLRANFTDTLVVKTNTTSFLHVLAESGHPDACGALLAALELGCDPKLRNGRKRVPSSCISDKEVQAQWRTVEQSFAARHAAELALNDILGAPKTAKFGIREAP